MSAAVPQFILYSFESSKKEFNAFLDVYYPVKCMIPPDTKITNLKLKSDRICRFCQRSVPEVTFKKKAHIIPESLGNKYLVSDFECDDCNEKVSKLETDFSAWLGAIKTLSGTKGKKGVPKFTPANNTIAAEHVTFLDTSATKISKGKASQSAFSLDKETNGVVYQFKKEGYVPIRAYKTLLKMALSMTDPEERDAYLRAFEFLIGPDENAPMQQFAKVICLELPLNHTIVKPIGQLFQKIDPLAKHPLHYFTLHYEHFIYGFPLPFNQVDIDKGCYGGNNIDVLYAPPITFWQPEKGSIFYSHTEDFSSAKKKVDDQQTISFNLSPEDLKKMKAIDPKTGEVKDGSITGEDIATLLILSNPLEIKKDQQFDLP